LVGNWGSAAGISVVMRVLFLLVFIAILSLSVDLGLAFWKLVSFLGFLAGLNTRHPFRHRLDNLILLAGRALFALVILTEEEQHLLLFCPKLEGLLLPLCFHQLEELQLSHSFALHFLKLLPVEVHATVIKVYLVVC